MKHSIYVVSSDRALPSNIVWCEPFAWNKDGQGTHFQKYPAFICEKQILGGWRYTVRACTLRVPPLELGEGIPFE